LNRKLKRAAFQNRPTEKIQDFVGLRAEITSATAARGNNFIASSCLKHECRGVTNYFFTAQNTSAAVYNVSSKNNNSSQLKNINVAGIFRESPNKGNGKQRTNHRTFLSLFMMAAYV
jgi:ectoine hydroxylase-related dioxygenase (phytanoyl-CoA dioxygenase family)